MKISNRVILILLFMPLVFLECGNKSTSKTDNSNDVQNISRHPDWNNYWYSGEAELTSYKLEQARYGEIHNGHSVLVFVTEPFSKKKQVKLDYPNKAGKDNVSVLKLNFTKKFNTGIYPYSLMQSIFTPVEINEYPNSLKTSMSGQEWCGHVFAQMNLEGNEYKTSSFSYFESEGDKESSLPAAILEDEIWNRIRIAPESLPLGEVKMIPGALFSRLLHKEIQAKPVTTSLSDLNTDLQEYKIEYRESGRVLAIRFKKEFPYEIEGWEEAYKNPFNGKQMVTKATKKKRIKSPYWSQNRNEHLYLRDSLGLAR
ncbi:MAG: hypothetical protein AAF363_00580 [Bacteroidota bacterium]